MVCVYTTGSGGAGPLRDPDGVRCWLPCIDYPDQRAVYDVTIRAPQGLRVASCGKRVSSVPYDAAHHQQHQHQWEGDEKGEDKKKKHHRPAKDVIIATRFVTATRLPALAVGFFVGQVETYRMPLYRAHGRLWVALGLSDYDMQMHTGGDGGRSNSSGGSSYFDNKKGSSGASVQRFVEKDNVMAAGSEGDEDAEGGGRPPAKRARGSSISTEDRQEAGGVKEKQQGIGDGSSSSSSNGNSIVMTGPFHHAPPPARDTLLYADEVRHSTLGLDLALRLIH